MRKTAALFCLVILLAMAGCSGVDLSRATDKDVTSEDIIEHKMTFKGESEAWTGELIVDCAQIFHIEDGTLCVDTDDKSLLTVNYKGDLSKLDDSTILRIDYEGSGVEQTGSLREASIQLHVNGANVASQETATTDVKVTLNGEEQTITLKQVDNVTNSGGNSGSHRFEEHLSSFWGQTDSWYCDFRVTSVSTYAMHDGKLSKDNKKDYELIVNYKGNISELADLRHLAIALDSPVAKGNLDETFSEENPPQQFYKIKGSLDTEFSPEDIDSVTVSITMDDETKKFKLSDDPTSADSDYIQNNYVFTGESENWTGEMDVESWQQFFERDGVLGCDSGEYTVLTVTYKGNVSELSSVKHIKIDYDTGSGSGSMEEELSADEPIQETTFTMRSGGSGMQIQKNEIITVTVTIDDKTESFEMKNQG